MKWAKCRFCAWDSNPRLLDGRLRRIHQKMWSFYPLEFLLGWPASFPFFSSNKCCSIQRVSNLDRQSRRQAWWPLDLHLVRPHANLKCYSTGNLILPSLLHLDFGSSIFKRPINDGSFFAVFAARVSSFQRLAAEIRQAVSQWVVAVDAFFAAKATFYWRIITFKTSTCIIRYPMKRRKGK